MEIKKEIFCDAEVVQYDRSVAYIRNISLVKTKSESHAGLFTF